MNQVQDCTRIQGSTSAEVAELADAHGSGPCESNLVWVRLPSSAPRRSFTSDFQDLMIVALHQILVVFRKLLLLTFSFAKEKVLRKRK